MAFGPIMKMKVGELAIELAPIKKEDLGEFVSPGMQQASVTQYFIRRNAPVFEDEVEWFDRKRHEENSVVWGIYSVENGERKLIGSTGLHEITKSHTIQSVSGSMIFRKEYWGKGIATAVHKARTWYAFIQLGHTRIKSAVYWGNIASKKALEKSGYNLVYVERNTAFIDGTLRHEDNLECLNPSEQAWSLWWGNDEPPQSSLAARERTHETIVWAEENVELL